MEILTTRILRGPNYWSNYRKKLIVLDVDLKEFEYKPTNLIPNFSTHLKEILPTLYQHYCSEGVEGGFFQRVEEGTWLGHVIEHVALELQWLAGMECGYGRTRSANKPGVYHVIFAYHFEEAGIYAAKTAYNIVYALAHETTYTTIDDDIHYLKSIVLKEKLGPSTEALVEEINKRHIPYQRIDNASLIALGQGNQQKFLLATETSQTNVIAVELASDKDLTKKMLNENHIPVPHGMIINNEEELALGLEAIAFPVVLKPLNSNHGRGVTCNVMNKVFAQQAFYLAKQYCEKIILEEFINGVDYRFLLVNFKVVAVAEREPAKIIGDGESTIQELIDDSNCDPKRGHGHDNYLTAIEVDSTTMSILQNKQLALSSVLKDGEVLFLKHAANLSSGGTAKDVTDHVHPKNMLMLERVARLMNLDVCGIDVIAQDIKKPLSNHNGAVIEVNSGPGLRMHLSPNQGAGRNVAKAIVEMLYPIGTNGRIPLIAVTGTNGKTTVVRLISHLVAAMGYIVGFTTTDGIYINHEEVFSGDCSRPDSANVVLRDPLIEYAVLECARGGILRRGLGFDHCDMSIVTNVTEDHLGIDGIETLEEMARVKSVVARSTFKHGYAILNSDNDLVFQMQADLDCQVALFSLTKSVRIQAHLAKNGIACYIDEDKFFIARGDEVIELCSVFELPMTFSGMAISMIKNLLPVFLCGYLNNFDMQRVIDALKAFTPSPRLLPGRMNVFQFGDVTVMLDYAHNPDAFNDLKNYISAISATRKIGIIAATGDRRKEDIMMLGKYSAQMFDEIIIRHDKDSRGRSNQQLTEWLMSGIELVDKVVKVEIISDESEAIIYALNHAQKGSFIFYFPDKVQLALQFLNKLHTKMTIKRAAV